MISRLVERSRRPLSLSLAQAGRAPDGWREILHRIEGAAHDGLPIKAQVAPRPIGVLLGLQGTLNPFSAHETFAEIKEKSLGEKVARHARSGVPRAHDGGDIGSRYATTAWRRGIADFDSIFRSAIRRTTNRRGRVPSANLAAAQGRLAAEVAYDLLLEDEGRTFLFMPFANYANYNLDCCGEMIGHPDCVMGLGDGGAHVGLISDGSYPTYLLAHWGRDRARGQFDLAYLVKRQTMDTARAVGLNDRGVIAPGMKADLNVIDFDKLRVEAPHMAFDLPAGGKRLLQGAKGYVATILSGEITYREGAAMDALPGRLIRGPQSAPSSA